MASSLKSCFNISGLSEIVLSSKTKGASSGFCTLKIGESKSQELPILKIGFMGKPLVISDQTDSSIKAPINFSVHAQASICVSRALRWWEKTLKPNMVEIHSAEELVDSLLNAGDKLVIIDFYSSGCGGCKSLHPKICQLAESNPDSIFLKVNYEELKTMCHCLHIHVLPFFRLYRGAEGRLCSFSCTNATIKKFKDALAKYGVDRCSLEPPKGLDESEILALQSAGELAIKLPYQFSTNNTEERAEDFIMKKIYLSSLQLKEEAPIGV